MDERTRPEAIKVDDGCTGGRGGNKGARGDGDDDGDGAIETFVVAVAAGEGATFVVVGDEGGKAFMSVEANVDDGDGPGPGPDPDPGTMAAAPVTRETGKGASSFGVAVSVVVGRMSPLRCRSSSCCCCCRSC